MPRSRHVRATLRRSRPGWRSELWLSGRVLSTVPALGGSLPGWGHGRRPSPLPVRSWTTPSWPGCRPTRSPRSYSSPRPRRPTRCARRAAAGAPAGVVVVADYQSAGRGRFDRRWESPPGKSLLFSVLLRPGEQGCPVSRPPRRSAPRGRRRLAGAGRGGQGRGRSRGPAQVAERPGGRTTANWRASWPSRRADGSLVVGAGVNVDWAPGQGRDVPRAPAAGRPVDRGELLVETLLGLDRLYGRWDQVSERYRRPVPRSDARSRSYWPPVSLPWPARPLPSTTTAASSFAAATAPWSRWPRATLPHLKPGKAPNLCPQ